MSKLRASAITIIGMTLSASACVDSANGPVTYHQDIAPIMQQHCVSCHSEGNIGPFALGSFDDVKAIGDLVRVVTKNRTMPPSNVDNSGDCKKFVDARWLSDEEIAIIDRWVEGGMQEGDAASAPEIAAPEVEELKGEVVTMTMHEPYTPLGNEEYPYDDYRCFLLDVASDTDKFMTGFELQPGNRAIVHHLLIAGILSDEGEQQAIAKDAETPDEPGWPCFGGAEVDDVNMLAVWAPGRDVTRYPEGTGLRIKGGHKIVIQMHYNMAAGFDPDQSTVKLELQDEVDAEAIFGLVTASDFNLEPGQTQTSFEQSYPLTGYVPGEGLLMYGVFPHMHQLGESMDFTIKRAYSGPDAPETCLMDVPRWDFNWQQGFFYDSPIPITNEDEVKVSCTWNTTSVDHNVTWGEGTADEMCLVFTYITLMDGGPVDQFFE